MNILVVEDERNLADAICRILSDADYKTEVAYDGTTGAAMAPASYYDAIVLDVMLPGINGMEIVHNLRREGISTPVLLLTALTATTDKVEGLDAGADDYMTKPFENEELLARLRALTRRKGEVMLDVAIFGDLKLDLTNHELICGERRVHLSGKEFEVLRTMMATPMRVFSKKNLLYHVWGADAGTTENSVEAYVSFLRKKLSYIRSNTQITTLRMLGYRLEYIPDDEQEQVQVQEQ